MVVLGPPVTDSRRTSLTLRLGGLAKDLLTLHLNGTIPIYKVLCIFWNEFYIRFLNSVF